MKYEKNYSDRTVEIYKEALCNYEDFVSSQFGAFDPKTIAVNQVRAWMVDMGRHHYAITTIKLNLSALRSYCKYLRREGWLASNPLTLLASPKVPKPLPVWVREKDMDRIIDDSDFGEGFEAERDRLLIDMLYSTGMRRAEIVGLQDKDIDMAERNIRVTGKGNKQRIIPFGQELADLINNYINVRTREVGGPTEMFFTDADGEGITISKAYSIARKYLSNIPTLQKHGTHVFRHSFATNMLAEGADLMAVKELLGHASLDSTEVYTHLTPQELLQNYKKAHPRGK